MKRVVLGVLTAGMSLALVSCSAGPVENSETTVTSSASVEISSAPSLVDPGGEGEETDSGGHSSQVKVPSPTPPPPVPEPVPAPAPAPAPDPVIGFTGAPGADTPRVLDKTIASCGDPTIHQTGTTFFTDGTTGWTQQCANQMGY